MLQYLLFDLDGTLTDSSEGITKSVQYGLKSVGIEVENLEDLLVFIGPPLEYSFREYYHLAEEQIELAREKYRERYAKVGMFENALYPGMASLLKDMKKRGKHLAVASSKPEVYVRQILKYFNVEQYFEVIVGSGMDGTLGTKEEVVAEALRQLFKGEKVSTEETAMIGDRHFDIEGGKANQITTIGVEYGFPLENELREAKADFIVRSVEELHQFLLRGCEDADEKRMSEYKKVQKRKKAKEAVEERRQRRLLRANRTSLSKTADILLPMLVYFIVYDVVGVLVSLGAEFIGAGIGGSFYESMLANVGTVRGILVIFSLLVTMAVMLPMSKWEFFLKNKEEKLPVSHGIVMAVMAVSASLGLNLLFTQLHLVDISAQYELVAQAQGSVVIGVGIVLYGFVSPLAEETLFRGLVYNRMKEHFPKGMAMVVSAMFFGLYHGNLVQGIFGAILGLVMVWIYELTGKWYVPVVFHGLVNITSYLLTFIPLQAESLGGYISCAISTTIWVLTMIYMGMQKKNIGKNK